MMSPFPVLVWECDKDSSIMDYAVTPHLTPGDGNPADGKETCNDSITSCDKQCTVRHSFWGCYAPLNEGYEFVDKLHIHWGHTAGDAGWACNRYKSECDNKCVAYPDGRDKPISDING